MHTLTKATLALAVMGTAFAAPLQAQDRQPGGPNAIIVQPLSSFAAEVGNELNHELDRIPYAGTASGVVRVYFFVNGDGVSHNVRVVESSGRPWVDRVATRAVRRIDGLGQAPTAHPDGMPVLATIVFAADERQLRRLSRGIDDGIDALIASGAIDREVLALTLLPDRRY